MADTYRNIATSITSATPANTDTLIYTPETGKNGLLTACRGVVFVDSFAINNTAYLGTLKFSVAGAANPIVVRNFPIAPQNKLGTFLDLLSLFSPTLAFGFAPGSALTLSLDTQLQPDEMINIFCIAAEA